MEHSLDSLLKRQPDREAVCPEHGPYTSRNLLGKAWSKCPACDEIARVAAQREQESAAAKLADERTQRILGAAAIPKRFIGRTFDGFVADSDQKRHALTVVRDYAEQFDGYAKRGIGLILSGMPGTGKSHLAAALMQTMIGRKQVQYATCLDMIRAIRDTWRRDSVQSESSVLAHLRDLDLLVIDEVGVQYGTDGEQTVLFDVLDRRYREVKPTVVITNQDKDGLRGFVGERTFDRLAETCRWVPFDWPSYRPIARRQ